MHYVDLSPCDYFGREHAGVLRAVGWLSNSEAFNTGSTPPDVFDRLKALLADPWQPFLSCGVHECEICQFDRPCGQANLFVPGDAFLYVAPELIAHYVAAHGYCPPTEFTHAVMRCPDTRTMDYKKRFLESGGRALLAKKA